MNLAETPVDPPLDPSVVHRSAAGPGSRIDSRIFRFGIFEVHAGTGELRRDGRVVLQLREQSLQVLLSLLERPREVVTREELRHRLWSADTFVDFDHGLNAAVNQLRNALGDSAANPRFIQTVPRRGYRFIVPIELLPALDAPQVDAESSGQPPLPSEPPVVPGLKRRTILADSHELPVVSWNLVRLLFSLIQLMYLSFYVVALARLHGVGEILLASEHAGRTALAALIVTAAAGIPIRLYLFSAAVFNYRELASKFTKLFLIILVLDELWALAPFLLVANIGMGSALAATAALVYLPFSQRSLLLMGLAGRK